MKRWISMAMLVSMAMLSASAPGGAEPAQTRLDMAFGLFSVTFPGKLTIVRNLEEGLAELGYKVKEGPMMIYANHARLIDYDDTAARRLNGLVSMLFAISGPGNGYSETPIQEETLPDGTALRWQLMRGANLHALYFEARTKHFGYNMAISGPATDAQDELMLAAMRSFRADAGREQDLVDLNQTRLADGRFISVDHALSIRLDDAWNPVNIESLLREDTALFLEKGDGRWLIQLLRTGPVGPDDGRKLLGWAMKNMRGEDEGDYPEPVAVPLEHLGVQAWVVEEQREIFMRNVAFVYEGWGYFGAFMWIVPDDAEARPYMDAAMRSLSPAEGL